MGIRRAANAASRLLRDLRVHPTPPVDIEAIARQLGIDIVERAGLRLPGRDGLSGLLLQRKGHTICVVNRDHHINRRRFTIAHEIGHYLLHPRQESFIDPDFSLAARDNMSSEGVDPQEIEANAFAAELLMPGEWLLNEVRRPHELDVFEDATIKHLAQRYGVSVQAMTLRLTNLGLLSSR